MSLSQVCYQYAYLWKGSYQILGRSSMEIGHIVTLNLPPEFLSIFHLALPRWLLLLIIVFSLSF